MADISFGNFVRSLNNWNLLRQAFGAGYVFTINDDTYKLHHVDPHRFCGRHNLHNARLDEFIFLQNIDNLPVHLLPDGTELFISDLLPGQRILSYSLNKCQYCFPPQGLM